MPTEPLTTKDVITELNTQWTAGNVANTTPQLIEATGTGYDATADTLRFDLNRGDALVARPGNPALEETPIGNWNYGNRTYNMELEFYTRVDRQRLYDLMAEVRRICHARMHSFTSFQRVQFRSFTEQAQEQVNIWTGIADIQLVNQMVLLET